MYASRSATYSILYIHLTHLVWVNSILLAQRARSNDCIQEQRKTHAYRMSNTTMKGFTRDIYMYVIHLSHRIYRTNRSLSNLGNVTDASSPDHSKPLMIQYLCSLGFVMTLGVCRRWTISFQHSPGRPPLSNKNNINNNRKQIHTHCLIITLSHPLAFHRRMPRNGIYKIKCNGSSENAPIYPIYMVTSRHTVALAVAYYVRTTLSIPTDYSVSFQLFAYHNFVLLFSCW